MFGLKFGKKYQKRIFMHLKNGALPVQLLTDGSWRVLQKDHNLL
jgi:hypothetical protein